MNKIKILLITAATFVFVFAGMSGVSAGNGSGSSGNQTGDGNGSAGGGSKNLFDCGSTTLHGADAYKVELVYNKKGNDGEDKTIMASIVVVLGDNASSNFYKYVNEYAQSISQKKGVTPKDVFGTKKTCSGSGAASCGSDTGQRYYFVASDFDGDATWKKNAKKSIIALLKWVHNGKSADKFDTKKNKDNQLYVDNWMKLFGKTAKDFTKENGNPEDGQKYGYRLLIQKITYWCKTKNGSNVGVKAKPRKELANTDTVTANGDGDFGLKGFLSEYQGDLCTTSDDIGIKSTFQNGKYKACNDEKWTRAAFKNWNVGVGYNIVWFYNDHSEKYNYTIDAACHNCKKHPNDNNYSFVFQDTTDWDALDAVSSLTKTQHSKYKNVQSHFLKKIGSKKYVCREEYYFQFPDSNNPVGLGISDHFTVNDTLSGSGQTSAVPNFSPIKVTVKAYCKGYSGTDSTFKSAYKKLVSKPTITLTYTENADNFKNKSDSNYNLTQTLTRTDGEAKVSDTNGSKQGTTGTLKTFTQTFTYKLKAGTYRYLVSTSGKYLSTAPSNTDQYTDMGIETLPISTNNQRSEEEGKETQAADILLRFSFDGTDFGTALGKDGANTYLQDSSQGDTDNIYAMYLDGKGDKTQLKLSACAKIYGYGTSDFKTCAQNHKKKMASNCYNYQKNKSWYLCPVTFSGSGGGVCNDEVCCYEEPEGTCWMYDKSEKEFKQVDCTDSEYIKDCPNTGGTCRKDTSDPDNPKYYLFDKTTKEEKQITEEEYIANGCGGECYIDKSDPTNPTYHLWNETTKSYDTVEEDTYLEECPDNTCTDDCPWCTAETDEDGTVTYYGMDGQVVGSEEEMEEDCKCYKDTTTSNTIYYLYDVTEHKFEPTDKESYEEVCPDPSTTGKSCEKEYDSDGNVIAYYNKEGTSVTESEYCDDCSCDGGGGDNPTPGVDQCHIDTLEVKDDDGNVTAIKYLYYDQKGVLIDEGSDTANYKKYEKECDCGKTRDCPAGINVVYRTIDLANAFPGTIGNGRETGTNWCSYDSTTKTYDCSTNNAVSTKFTSNNRDTKDENVYNLEPVYSFVINSDNIKAIREYNDKCTYDETEGNCSSQTFLKGNSSNYYSSKTGTCSSGNTSMCAD